MTISRRSTYLPFRGRWFPAANSSGPLDLCSACGAVVHEPWLGRYLFDAKRNGTGITRSLVRSYLVDPDSEATGVGRSLRNTRDAASPNDCQFSSADFNATGNATTSALGDALERNGDDAVRNETGDTDATFDAT
jgi:hypothetical protein